VDILSIFCGVFVFQRVKFMQSLNLGFYCLTVLFIAKSNLLSETFYQVGWKHNHGQTRSCLLNRCVKNYSV